MTMKHLMARIGEAAALGTVPWWSRLMDTAHVLGRERRPRVLDAALQSALKNGGGAMRRILFALTLCVGLLATGAPHASAIPPSRTYARRTSRRCTT